MTTQRPLSVRIKNNVQILLVKIDQKFCKKEKKNYFWRLGTQHFQIVENIKLFKKNYKSCTHNSNVFVGNF